MITRSKNFWTYLMSSPVQDFYLYALSKELRIPLERSQGHFGEQPEESACLASQSFLDEMWISGTPFSSQRHETAGYFIESTWRFAMLAAGNSAQGWTVINTNSLIPGWMSALTVCYYFIDSLLYFKCSIRKHIEQYFMYETWYTININSITMHHKTHWIDHTKLHIANMFCT